MLPAEVTHGGAGIAIGPAGNVTIIGSTIAENASASGGGGLYSESSAVAIVNSTFKHNRTEFGPGGGMLVAGGVVVNTTFGNNHSFSGGRALAANSALALHNTIISGPSDPISFACHGKLRRWKLEPT